MELFKCFKDGELIEVFNNYEEAVAFTNTHKATRGQVGHFEIHNESGEVVDSHTVLAEFHPVTLS